MSLKSFAPKHWSDHAEEARATAAEMNDLRARQTLLVIADAYDRLAERAKRITLRGAVRLVPK